MIIVAGWLEVAPDRRAAYLDGCEPVIRAARAQPGCLDFCVSADPLADGRIYVYERWDRVESVERFRESGPSDEQHAAILAADVAQYEIADITPLT